MNDTPLTDEWVTNNGGSAYVDTDMWGAFARHLEERLAAEWRVVAAYRQAHGKLLNTSEERILEVCRKLEEEARG